MDFVSLKLPSAHIFARAHFMRAQRCRESVLTHCHDAERIQIIGPLKSSNVNWAKLQQARVAVAGPDVYIIAVHRRRWQEKRL